MWSEVLAAASETPPTQPGLPYEQIGLVLVALVTGLTAVVVAIIQKGKPPATPPPSAPPVAAPGGSFVVSEVEWIAVRDRSLMTAAKLESLLHEYHTHEQVAGTHMARTNMRVEAIGRRVGFLVADEEQQVS